MSFGPNMTAASKPWPDVEPVKTAVPFSYIHINKCGGSSVTIALGLPKSHETAVERREKIGADAWDAAFTFATVRNPFDRVASIYYYRVRTDRNGMADRHLNFNQWIERVFRDRDPAYWEDDAYIAPAADWITEKGEVIVDEVFKLEEIASGWPRICERLGITVDLAVTNNNSRPPYNHIFTEASRRIIERAFAEDLERFGYRFEET